ncbi:MAG: hypothetical protein RLZZ306_3078 [Bacteroidota bacterium]|jgi:hypothetical protein
MNHLYNENKIIIPETNQMRDFIQVYPNSEEIEPTGGYVYVHNTHVGDEREKNIKTAIFLAKLGYQVHLLEVVNIQGHKNPDAYIVNEDIIIEFKQNERATQSAIENEIRDAKKQAEYILIQASEYISAKDLLAGIKSKYRRREPEYLKMKDLWLIWKGELFIFTRQDIINGEINHKIR